MTTRLSVAEARWAASLLQTAQNSLQLLIAATGRGKGDVMGGDGGSV